MAGKLIIIGSGLAGYNVAKEFRKHDAETPILIITVDDGAYYSKPMLSSAFTTKKTPHMLPLGDADKMRKDLNADIKVFTHVSSIDTKNKKVITDNGEFEYGQCVIACGANVIPAPLTGTGTDEVFHVNNLMDYRAFRDVIDHKQTIALLGAGLIGCEFANDLMNAGKDVHCIALSKTPLDLLLPEEAGAVLRDAMTERGVNWHLEQKIDDVKKTGSGLSLRLSDGSTIEADCLLSAIGIRPNLEFAKASGIKVNKGIIVDTALQTSAPDVYALGDCAEVRGLVLQYVAPILQCSRALAKTLAGDKTAVSYPAMPVVVKTPAHPVVVCGPLNGATGEWSFDINEEGVVGKFASPEGELLGFILTNKNMKLRQALAKQLPLWL